MLRYPGVGPQTVPQDPPKIIIKVKDRSTQSDFPPSKSLKVQVKDPLHTTTNLDPDPVKNIESIGSSISKTDSNDLEAFELFNLTEIRNFEEQVRQTRTYQINHSNAGPVINYSDYVKKMKLNTEGTGKGLINQPIVLVCIWILLILLVLMTIIEIKWSSFLLTVVLAMSLYTILYLNVENKTEFLLVFWTRIKKCFKLLGEVWQKSAPVLVKKSEAERKKDRLDFAAEDHLLDETGVVHLDHEIGGREPTNFNYKVKIKVEDDDWIICELDSDSHISLVSETYFNRLKDIAKITYLPGQPITFNGLGSEITSPHPSILLNVQIGRVSMKGTFVVTPLLTSSPVLLGTDFTVRYKLSVAPYTGDQWFVTVGPLDDPISKVPAFITNKVSLFASQKLHFQPFEIKKVTVSSDWNGMSSELVQGTTLHKKLRHSETLKDSPFILFEDTLDHNNQVSIQNRSTVEAFLPAGLTLADSDVDLSTYQVSQPGMQINELKFLENGEVVESTAELEALLEPGFSPPNFIDKETELNFIKTHKNFPEEFKGRFIEFLEKRPSLFSGEEFSKKCFPKEEYSHDVELINENEIPQLNSRPFPVSGIRLNQLRSDINELVKNGILSPGDSEFTSPIFYVLKKSGEGKTAAKGRLCFDYRKINSHIKSKNFPLSSSKNFFDGASNFKYFCILDIKNAFLSIPLTERARKLLAIITPFGTFLPNRTPYGLKTSPSAFCFCLYKVIGDLKFCHYYMDDIHVGGTTKEELFNNLLQILERLHKFNLKIQLSKTKFYVKSVKVLGVIFSAVGKRIDPDKIAAIKNFGEIDTLKKCQSFLGMLAFIGSFIPHFSSTCAPLYALLKDQKTKKYEVTKEALVAYDAIKKYIGDSCMLYHPQFHNPFYLATDASNLAAGAFLYQVKGYKRTEKGRAKMLSDLGFEIEEGGMEPYMLPGVSPGKNTPVVTEFAGDPKKVSAFDKFDTLKNTSTTV